MSRLTKDYLKVSGDHVPLDDLIAQLTAIRDTLPADAGARVKLSGNEDFGRHLCVAYQRPLTAEEADVLNRYGGDVHRLKRAA